MAMRSCNDLRHSKTHLPGFSLAEMLISVTILGLIATAVVFDLRATRAKDELGLAARILMSDLRSLQSRGLTAQSIKSCVQPNALRAVCESDTSVCVDPTQCLPLPPLGIGLHATTGTASYSWFAEVDPAPEQHDWKLTNQTEVISQRDFNALGAAHVHIAELFTTEPVTSVDVAFQRQNGSMGINGCFLPCQTPSQLRIRLRHEISQETKDIVLHALTGRISFE